MCCLLATLLFTKFLEQIPDGTFHKLYPPLLNCHMCYTANYVWSMYRFDLVADLIPFCLDIFSDYHKKPNTLAPLRKKKALDKNPDEFYFKMVSSQLKVSHHVGLVPGLSCLVNSSDHCQAKHSGVRPHRSGTRLYKSSQVPDLFVHLPTLLLIVKRDNQLAWWHKQTDTRANTIASLYIWSFQVLPCPHFILAFIQNMIY